MNVLRPAFVLSFMAMFCSPIGQAAGAEKLSLVAGGGTGDEGVSAVQAKLQDPFGVAFDKADNMYIVELTGHRVLKVDGGGKLTKIGGTGHKGDSGDGGPALQAAFNSMHSLAVASNGDIYIADTLNHRIRKMDARTGMITTVAGTGKKGFGGDGGPAIQAQFSGIYSIAFDAKEEKLYLADLDNRRIRAVDLRNGVVGTVAGNGKKGVPEDGADARSSPLIDPRAVAVDRRGNVYILERSGHALRVVEPNGKIRTVAGSGKPGATGDGGDAKRATLRGPKHICIDLEDNVIIADTDNHVIRKYLAREGKIVRIAGTGKKGDRGLGGAPLKAELDVPHGVYVHPTGTLYIADSGNHRVLRIDREGQTGKPMGKKTYTYKTVGNCDIKADVYLPSEATNSPAVIWIHGGALIMGDRDGVDRPLFDKLLKAGFAVVSIDYRLAPETKLPAILEDVQDAYQWVREKGPRLFQVDPKRIAVMGGSAGGYLTLTTGFRVEPRPKALVSFWGYGDIAGTWYSRPDPFYSQMPAVQKDAAYKAVGDSIISASSGRNNRSSFYLYCRQQGLWPKEVAGHDPDKEPKAFDSFCPLRNVSAKYPPTLLIHGTKDTDVPYEQSELMAKELTRQRVEHELISVKDAGHGLGGQKPEIIAEIHDRVVAFLIKHMKD